MKKLLIPLAAIVMLSGCATGSAIREKLTNNQFDEPVVSKPTLLEKNTLRPPAGGPIPVAVYTFADKTGQRKYSQNYASFSTAVTQGAEGFVIKSLQEAGDGRWFRVVERVGLDNLIKERQMIRQMREAYQGKEAQPLPPMVFAGVIIEGGIVGYDSNSITGGAGVSVFGIGGTTQYQSDTVTINLRTVSVQSGEILTNVTVTKTVLSYMDKLTLMRWFNNGVDTIESELGGSINESINKAVDLAVQAAVVQTINEGVRKGHWSFKEEPKHVELISQPAPVATPVPAAIKQEPKADPAPEPKKESAKKESASVVGTMYLTDTSFVYKEPNEKSQRTWQLLKGTEFKVTPAVDGWIAVVANDGKKGYVRREVLSTEPIVVPAVVKGNEPSVKK